MSCTPTGFSVISQSLGYNETIAPPARAVVVKFSVQSEVWRLFVWSADDNGTPTWVAPVLAAAVLLSILIATLLAVIMISNKMYVRLLRQCAPSVCCPCQPWCTRMLFSALATSYIHPSSYYHLFTTLYTTNVPVCGCAHIPTCAHARNNELHTAAHTPTIMPGLAWLTMQPR